MLRRSMWTVLSKWLEEGPSKAFLLVGARQTGKTYLVRAFAQEKFSFLAEVNFLKDRRAISLLGAASDTEDFLARLSLLVKVPLRPHETLVFLDEIQEAPDVLTAVKFLIEDGRFPLAVSGSLLGTELKGVRSFPVGYVQVERMYPLGFEEFCWAQNVPDNIWRTVRNAYESRSRVEDSLHAYLTSLFRYYLAIGGMPEAVQTYLASGYDMGAVRQTALQILEQYRFDIAKYVGRRALAVRSIFDAMPSQLSKENKRFKLNTLGNKATYNRYENDFQWIIDAGVALPAYCVSEPKSPLPRTKEINKFKLYSSDTGLLLAQYPQQSVLDVMEGASSVNFGAVYENAVAQALSIVDPNLYYYLNNRKGEVDFLVETSRGEIMPVEVKSGKDYKVHVALNNLLDTAEYGISEAVVLSEANLSTEQRKGKLIAYLPLYMTPFLAEEMKDTLAGVRMAPPRPPL
ncbi:ATP-binding protein [Adlercreutzia sp. ZJ242]|uniref:ATP-binding protein n=1 Tax=Adlercreutzia sp. ZJ242 TaxID=2709409 RepID=UPI0013EB9C7F|nr:AAA family ATPase [Adlercreutzia sp. ZJ242]